MQSLFYRNIYKTQFNIEKHLRWKEVQDVGKRKARWDGNGNVKEWRKRSERERDWRANFFINFIFINFIFKGKHL